MAELTASFDGHLPVPVDVTWEQDYIEVRSDRAVKPDPDWLFEDAAGHLHIWTGLDEDDEPARVPSCVVREEPCDGACGDPTHTWPVHYCAECDERVKPGFVPDWEARRGKSIPGMRTATVKARQPPMPLNQLVALGPSPIRVVVDLGGELMSGTARWNGNYAVTNDGLSKPLKFHFRPDDEED